MEITRIKEKKSLHTFKDSTSRTFVKGTKYSMKWNIFAQKKPNSSYIFRYCSALFIGYY